LILKKGAYTPMKIFADHISPAKRFLLACLLAAMILAVLSCSQDTKTGQNNNEETKPPEAAGEGSGEEDAGAGRENTPDGVPPDLKFSGKTFTILSREEFMFGYEMGVDEENGDIVNDVIYKRNVSVENRFDIKVDVIKIPGIWGQEASFNNTVKNCVKAGDNLYDLVAGYAYFITPLAAEGNFLNWAKAPYIDNSAPWWNLELVEKTTIDGKLYFITGDLSLTFVSNLTCLYFNKRIQSEYEAEDVYKLVLDGKWTYDKMFEVCRGVYRDLNGDGIKNEGDIFGAGLAHGNTCEAVFTSQDQQITEIGDDGYPYFVFNSPRTIKIVENMMTLFFDNAGIYSFAETTEYPERTIFKNGQSLFMNGYINTAEDLRDMTDDFGVVPYPKFDETQKKYRSRSQDAFSFFSVLSTCDDYEFAGAVTEALAAESYRFVTPTYYETALKIKYSRDDTTSQMLDIIREGAQFDFAYVYSNSLNNIVHIFRNLTDKKSTDFVSLYEKSESQYKKALDKLIAAYQELE